MNNYWLLFHSRKGLPQKLAAISICSISYTVFAQSVAAATNVFNLCGGRPLFKSGVYLIDCALPQELNDYVMVFVNV